MRVGVDESYGAGIVCFGGENHLEESGGDSDVCFAYCLVVSRLVDGAGHYYQGAVSFGPDAFFFLKGFPGAGIETVFLGRHVGHREALPHAFGTPFRIACRVHVSTVVTGTSVVRCVRTA